MSRYKCIEYTKYIGCHHGDNDELTGGTPVEMIALFDSERISEEHVQECIQLDMETPHLMLINKKHYDNVLKPAVDEARRAVLCDAE
jgi:hypothetical protein